jgi:hypothetical protein
MHSLQTYKQEKAYDNSAYTITQHGTLELRRRDRRLSQICHEGWFLFGDPGTCRQAINECQRLGNEMGTGVVMTPTLQALQEQR